MGIEVVKKDVFITTDGLEFTDEAEARRHEERIKGTRYFKVFHGPDLTETGILQRSSVVSSKPRHNVGHELFVEEWAYKKFGSRAAYVQGVARTENWLVAEMKKDAALEEGIDVVLEDD